MHIRFPAAAAAAICLGLLADPSWAGRQDFYIRNNGGNYVYYVQISPSHDTSWRDDILGSDVLEPYTETLIEMIGYSPDECLFDIRIEDENGYKREYYKVDLCSQLYVDFP